MWSFPSLSGLAMAGSQGWGTGFSRGTLNYVCYATCSPICVHGVDLSFKTYFFPSQLSVSTCSLHPAQKHTLSKSSASCTSQNQRALAPPPKSHPCTLRAPKVLHKHLQKPAFRRLPCCPILPSACYPTMG